MRRALALLALLPVLIAAGCGGDDENEETSGDGGGETQECREVEAPEPKPDGGQEAPTEALDAGTTYTITFETSCGSFTVTLDQKTSPKTTASLVSLARAGFYDDTTVHRIVPGFVVQGGDPTGTGTGGPGYQTVDPPPAGTRYTRGVVAMAKTQVEPPGTAGSQFFVVTGDDVGLPPDYAVVGTVTAGVDTVARMDALGGDPQSGTPPQPVVIESATVAES